MCLITASENIRLPNFQILDLVNFRRMIIDRWVFLCRKTVNFNFACIPELCELPVNLTYLGKICIQEILILSSNVHNTNEGHHGINITNVARNLELRSETKCGVCLFCIFWLSSRISIDFIYINMSFTSNFGSGQTQENLKPVSIVEQQWTRVGLRTNRGLEWLIDAPQQYLEGPGIVHSFYLSRHLHKVHYGSAIEMWPE